MAWIFGGLTSPCSPCCRSSRDDRQDASDAHMPVAIESDRQPHFVAAGGDVVGEPAILSANTLSSNMPIGEDDATYVVERRMSRRMTTVSTVKSESDSGNFNPMRVLPIVSRGVKQFRDHMLAVLPPNDVEVQRGVRIERIYDFYDPVVQAVRTRKMFGDTLHVRRDKRPQDLYPLCGDEESSTCSSNSSAASFPPLSPDSPKKPKLSKSSKLRHQELLVMWSVLVATLLHDCVVDFGGVLRAVTMRRLVSVKTDTSSTVQNSIRTRAAYVISQAKKMAAREARRGDDCKDAEWPETNIHLQLFGAEFLDTAMLIVSASQKLIASQPILVKVPAPCRIFGDTHGQLRDLLLLMHVYGFPSSESNQFVFNGDFVDRGVHQVAVVLLLFALKLVYPERVWLVRGNHEMRNMNEKYGFLDSCEEALGVDFGRRVFDLIQKVFDQLPLACIVADRVLVVHGGIGNGQWMLADLLAVQRPLMQDHVLDPQNAWIMNLLWSDPIEDDGGSQEVFGVHESPRGTSDILNFGWNVTKNFCARNGLSLVVRSHQSKAGSLGFDVMHDNMLIRVFSARDYEGHGNDSATLLLSPQSLDGGKIMLRVRPQVLRSVTKQRHERILERMGSGELDRGTAAGKDHKDALKARQRRRRAMGSGALESDSRWARGNFPKNQKPPPAG